MVVLGRLSGELSVMLSMKLRLAFSQLMQLQYTAAHMMLD